MDTISCQPLLDRLTALIIKDSSDSEHEFNHLLNTLEKIKFCMNYKSNSSIILSEMHKLLNALYETCDHHRKNETLALAAKEKGSMAFLKKNDIKGHELYSDCIRLSPPNSSLLPIAYANRSAVLLKMERYQECLEDIHRAEDLHYPQDLLYKLMVRKMTAYYHLSLITDVSSTLIEAKKLIPLVSLKYTDNYVKSLEQFDLILSGFNQDINENDNKTTKENVTSLYDEESSNVKYLSSAFKMSVNSKEGRHLVATSAVPRGSMVFNESPFASILLPEFYLSHCNYCCGVASNSIPCPSCCDIVYCRSECQKQAWQYHQYECGLLHILSSVGVAHLALRVVLVAGWNICKTISNEPTSVIDGVGVNGVYNGDETMEGYRAVYHLMTHLDHALPVDQIQYALAAIVLAQTIHDKTVFIENVVKSGEKLTIVDLASVIMHHIAQLVTNAHAITRIIPINQGDNIEQVNQRRIASAIYPSASLMNHCCKPSVMNSFQNCQLIVHTIEDIAPGDQLLNCYGPHYCRLQYKERQEALMNQYFFTCKCVACMDQEAPNREANWIAVLCSECSGSAIYSDDCEEKVCCLDCFIISSPTQQMTQDCTNASSLYDQGKSWLEKNDVEEALECLGRSLSIGTTVYHRDNQFLNDIRDLYTQALVITGDLSSACHHLRQCLTYVDHRYGSSSIELGHEYLKYFMILKATKCNAETLQSTENIIENIFSINYGAKWRSYLQIDF